VRDAVAYECAGDIILQEALMQMEVDDCVAFIKNNIDHHTGATFGCHENYLMRRDVQFHPNLLGTLLSFLATRQIFTGAGRVGQASPLAFDFDPPRQSGPVEFQISQRADHIVNDIYQWVQFNRAIINARDEPLADYRKYRRLHLLIGDSNMSPFACMLKARDDVARAQSVGARPPAGGRHPARSGAGYAADQPRWNRSRSRTTRRWPHARRARYPVGLLRGDRDTIRRRGRRTDWILENWRFTLDALATKPELLIGGVDWISKKWMLEQFREMEGLEWSDPWLQSLDLEYHNIDPSRGLFFGLTPAKAIGEFNDNSRRSECTYTPPSDTRANGRGRAVARFVNTRLPYVINWDSISVENTAHLPMPDPFDTYAAAADDLSRPERAG
jgi:proteasome accessory factor A